MVSIGALLHSMPSHVRATMCTSTFFFSSFHLAAATQNGAPQLAYTFLDRPCPTKSKSLELQCHVAHSVCCAQKA